MNENDDSTRRATLVVGYGHFGREVLRRLLGSAAPRGVLDWDEPRGGAGAGERTLRDLALLHVPDRIAVENPDELSATAEAGAAGLLGDLYRQIRVLEPKGDAASDLAAATVETAERLLSASARATRGDAQPLGLDVVVIARPDEPEVLGLLDNMLTAAMDALANNANLVRAVQGAEALNFLEILDFENYWDQSESGRQSRRAVANSLLQWEKRRVSGRPAYGRVYLVDGRTGDGIRDRRHRIDEISLFLELLLFEGQRGGELQRLWQPSGAHESPLAAFGVRLMEQSAGLLSRLAAARFAVDWLDHLAADDAGSVPLGGFKGGEDSEAPELELARRLAPYGAGELDRRLGADELRAHVDGEVRALEDELLELPSEAADWPCLVLAGYETASRRVEAHLSTETARRMEAVHRECLDRLGEDLQAGLATDLHLSRQPVPLGRAIRHLEETVRELEAPMPEPALAAVRDAATNGNGSSGGSYLDAAREDLEDLARDYRRFRRGQVRADGLRQQWWPLWAALLAAGITPILRALLVEIPEPDPTRFLLAKAYEALQWIANPVALAVLVFLLFWGLGALVLQRRVVARQDRAERFFHDRLRGRFADRLRGALEPTGSLGQPLYRELELTLRDMTLAVRSEVGRELTRVIARLGDRRREMLWLRDELRDFLKLHGLNLTGDGHELDRHQRDDAGIRQAVERGEDLELVLKRNPPTPPRFRSTQADQRPLEEWDERYSDAFLFPLAFLDRLSRVYEEGREDLQDPGEDFLAFLERHGSFDLAFAWKAQEGVPADRRYCLIPPSWRRLPGVLPRLADLATTEDNVLTGFDSSRAYLLRLVTGIDTDCLLEAGS